MGGLLLATIAGSAYWIDRLQDDISTLKGNQIVLETKIQEEQEAMRDVNRLRKTFASHDLDELTLAKPELMEGKINRASKRVLENLEKLTDPTQFDEEDSTNS